MRTTPYARWLLRAAGSLALAAVTCLSLELGHRAWLSARGVPYSAAEAVERMRGLLDTTAAYVPNSPAEDDRARVTNWLHPYYGSESYPDTGGVLRAFADGFPEDAYTIVVVGGSVAAAFSQAPASFLERVAASARLSGRDVRVLQYAHASYKQPQQVMRMAYLFSLGHRPDAVINLDGFNEVAATYHHAMKGIHPVYPAGEIWGGLVRILRDLDEDALGLYVQLELLRSEAEAVVARATRWGLLRSSLLGRHALSTLRDINTRRAALQEQLLDLPNPAGQRDPQAKGPDFDRTIYAILDIALESWFESSLSLQALCAARGVEYVHCLQPTLLDPGAKPLSEVEAALGPGARGWSEAVELGYPRLREAGAALAARGVHFVDLSRCFSEVEETLFIDSCHFTPEGNQRLGHEVAEAFLEALGG